MRFFDIVLIVSGILAVLIVLGTVWMLLRMRWAACKVRQSSYETKVQRLNQALSSFGFCYDEDNDVISTGMYPWQRKMGYCRAYDEAAARMYMIFDCEPIYFDYGGARYLIELWKGQYGCTTGAEIGLYVNREGDVTKAPENLFYECVSDEERLSLHFALYRNGNKILERRALHWWLTGFAVGMYSEPGSLSLEVGIGFPGRAMCRAFYNALLRAGYTGNEIYVEQHRVYLRFEIPHTAQPDSCGKICHWRVMRRNRKSCKWYNRVTKQFDTTLDKINYIGYCFPLLYRIIVRMGMKCNQGRMQKYQKKMR